MRQKRKNNMILGKRLKCGEVIIWNYNLFTCVVECTLCDDRPSCNLKDFFEHIQVWHQEWNDDDLAKCNVEKDTNEVDHQNEITMLSGTNIQPFEEVLIETEANVEEEYNVSDEENLSDDSCDTIRFEDFKMRKFKFKEKEILTEIPLNKADLSIDDLAFEDLNIQCSDINTTHITYEEDFRQWCRKQHLNELQEAHRELSVDSGVDKSELSSVATSPSQSMSDDNDSFDLNELNIKKQIKFGLNEPLSKKKLTADNMENLIELYREHPRLWQQCHDEYNNAHLCRQSWQNIMHKWNKICQVNFTEQDIRLRLSTLRQRYLKERERHKIHNEDENFSQKTYKIPSRFRYFKHLQFLDNQYQTPYTERGTRICHEYTKLIEAYAHFPILWDKTFKTQKSIELREKAYMGISTALQLLGIHLSIETIRLRLSTLKKRYRLEKIQRLQCQLKKRTFVPRFKHYEEMKYLDEHIAPFVCNVCGKIFRLLNEYQTHKEREKHSNTKITEYSKIKTQDTQSTNNIELEKDCKIIEPLEVVSENQHKTQVELSNSILTNNSNESVNILSKGFENPITVIETEPQEVLSKENSLTEKPQNSQTQQIERTEKETPSCEGEIATKLTTYVDEQELLMPLNCVNGNFNEVPIYIMDTTLTDQYQQTALPIYQSNILQSNTEFQSIIVDEALMKTMNLMLSEQQCRLIKPLVATTFCDEIKNQNDCSSNNHKNNEMSPEKVYANLVNAFTEHTDSENSTKQQTEIFNSTINTLINTNSTVIITENQYETETIMPKNYQNNQAEMFNAEKDFIGTKKSEIQSIWVHSEILDPLHNNEIVVQLGETTQSEMKITECTNVIQMRNTQQNQDVKEDLQSTEMNLQSPISLDATLPDAISSSFQLTEVTSDTSAKLDVTLPDEISSSLQLTEVTPVKVDATLPDTISSSLILTNEVQFESLKQNDDVVSTSSDIKTKEPIKITEIRILKPQDDDKTKNNNEHISENVSKNTRSSKALVANIKSDDFQIDIDLSEGERSPHKRKPYSLTRLTEPQSLKLIELYRLHPQLWDPEHPSYASRRHKRIAWRALSTQFNASFYLNYDWLQVQRKMMDFIKYYKKEQKRCKTKRNVRSWSFYENLKFLDKVNIGDSTLERRLQQRAQTLKIIEVYKDYPQLWDTEHELYTKRHQRQQTIALMRARLQEAYNITIEHGKLRQCLLDLRYNYRNTKLAKIEAQKRNETFEPASRFEFYDALQFLEPHVPPFNCEKCKINFKRFSEYSSHHKKEHKKYLRPQCPLLASDIDTNTLENICHICGIKFTMRHNLVQHLNRHYCERTLTCSTCGKKFFTKSAITEHERTHTKVPAVICSECGKTFFNASKLNQHLKRHRNQRDYPCEYCDKAFYTAFERERHTRRHLNIRDKICPVCGKSFVAGSAYYTHIKIHNKVKEYVCVACNLEFSQYAGLYKHRKRHHPDP